MPISDMITKPTGSPKLKVLIYGAPGVGKTLLAASAPNPLIVDIERGTTSLTQFPHLMDTAIIPYQSHKTMEAIVTEFIKKSAEVSNYETLVIDSISEFQRVLMDEHLSLAGGSKYVPELKDYSINTNMLRNMVSKLKNLHTHVVFTAHVKEDQDEVGRTTKGPDLTPKLANSLVGMMDVVGYLDVRTVKEKDKETQVRTLTLSPTRSIIAKSRIGGTTIVNPIFQDLLNLNNGKQG